MDTRGKPPFATPTLARLYLAQGHRDRAREMLEELEAAGAAGLDDVRAALVADREGRIAALEQLLDAVRGRRRPA